MNRSIAVIILASVSAVACGRGTDLVGPDTRGPELALVDDAVCPAQVLSCFHASMVLTAGGQSITVLGWSQDLPLPGYSNHWHYLLPASAAPLLNAFINVPTEASVGGAAVIWPDGRGGMFMEARATNANLPHWRLDMHPTDDGVAAQFANLAGSAEYRTQIFTVTKLNGGQVEILIEEEL
jgi:hypothetical protein